MALEKLSCFPKMVFLAATRIKLFHCVRTYNRLITESEKPVNSQLCSVYVRLFPFLSLHSP